MKITAIKAQKKRQGRVSVFADDEFWTGMTENLYLKLGLTPGLEIGEERKREIEQLVVEDKALSWAAERLARSGLSKGALAQKLREREYGEQVIEAVLERLEEYKLLDDRAYAEAVIEARRNMGHGRRRVSGYLHEKRVPRELAEELLDQAFDPALERQEADRVLRERYRDRRLDRREQRQAADFLIRRGFSPQTARELVSERALSREEEDQVMGVEQARVQLRRRYGSGQEVDRKKAFGYLSRRGFRADVIRRALEPVEDSY